ncbi:MAG: AAA family ATPase, partial [Acidimicrobiia bacterium]|nr:AAA family ATPase [Acidimicrobiia bacterium]
MATTRPEASSLARYVPRINAEWDRHTSEQWREIDGTLCYIDISGFTALSEKLAQRGRIGAEELTEVLNHVFGKMLGVAYDRGGSLLKFGGDALLLVFTGADHPIQACSAAVEMQAVLREARSYETSAGRLHLKMSVGLHSGAVHLFRVGDSHKELILTGPAASMTTEMEETAVAGEILISPATKAGLPRGSATKAKGDGWLLTWRKARVEATGWSPRIPLPPEAIAAGMPVALRQYLQYGKAEPEHHIATVGFIKYSGVDALMAGAGPGAVAAALEDLVRNVQEAVDEEGVTFLASDIDQDGGKIILVAGVPGVQEDDEGRVLRAARRIADRAESLQLRIGVNRGHVFVGEIGTDFRATYTIMGDTVNLAARLMAAASAGEVYASPSVLDRSLTLFETVPLEPFFVKGKEHPVQAYAVGAETGSRSSEVAGGLPFVGREEEIATLSGLFAQLANGRGGVMSIVGERGIGKSRLVDEVLPLLGDGRHLNIRAEPYGTATPYRALRDTVRGVLGVERSTPEKMAEQLAVAVAELAPELEPLLPLIAEVAMIEIAPTPQSEAVEQRFRMDRTAEIMVELLDAALDGPVLFEVEDGHWMDEASAHLLATVAEMCDRRPWLLLVTRRADSAGLVPAGPALELQPLSPNEAAGLVIEATAGAPLRPHDLDAIVDRAGGLPLFLEEIVRAVRMAGSVEGIPDSLEAIVSTQIDGLEPLTRRLLRFASVLGRSFRVSTLNELLAEEPLELDAATQRQLASFLEYEGTERMRFRHSLLRDAAYEGLSFRRRRELHLRAGQTMEDQYRSDPEAVADMLALHYSQADDHEKTWRYARVAGDEAMANYANVEAAVQYERALAAGRRLTTVPADDLRVVWTKLGDVHEEVGLYAEALEAFRQASRQAHDPVDHADLMLRRARARSRAGAYRSALSEATRGLRFLAGVTGQDVARAKARLTSFSAVIRQTQQRPREALVLAEQAADEALASGEKEALARAYEVMD